MDKGIELPGYHEKIQTYVHINDIIPTEGYWPDVNDKVEPVSYYTKEQLYESIKKEGFIHQLKIGPGGRIINGNMRYWTARRLYEEGDLRFQFLPVEYRFYSGFMPITAHLDKEQILGMQCVQEELMKLMNINQPVLPPNPMRDYPIKDNMTHRGGFSPGWTVEPVLLMREGIAEHLNKNPRHDQWRRHMVDGKWVTQRYNAKKKQWYKVKDISERVKDIEKKKERSRGPARKRTEKKRLRRNRSSGH
jgi:hypothetical protein